MAAIAMEEFLNSFRTPGGRAFVDTVPARAFLQKAIHYVNLGDKFVDGDDKRTSEERLRDEALPFCNITHRFSMDEQRWLEQLVYYLDRTELSTGMATRADVLRSHTRTLF